MILSDQLQIWQPTKQQTNEPTNQPNCLHCPYFCLSTPSCIMISLITPVGTQRGWWIELTEPVWSNQVDLRIPASDERPKAAIIWLCLELRAAYEVVSKLKQMWGHTCLPLAWCSSNGSGSSSSSVHSKSGLLLVGLMSTFYPSLLALMVP